MIRRYLDPGFFLIVIGASGMLVSAFADAMGLGRPGFGIGQLSGLVIGATITIAGVVNIIFHDARLFVRFLAGIYLCGIFYAGLRPHYCESAQHNVKVLLDFHNYGLRDFAINTVGFMPLGYLLMLSFRNQQKDQGTNLFKRTMIVAAIGGLISLSLEVSQYYLISGRASSLFDCISNTLGTLLGIAAYLVLSREPGYAATK